MSKRIQVDRHVGRKLSRVHTGINCYGSVQDRVVPIYTNCWNEVRLR